MPLSAGALRNPIEIQAPVVTQDRDGGQRITWAMIHRGWARVAPTREAERLIAAQVGSRETHRITLRWFGPLPPTYRILRLEDGRVLEPISVRDIEERHEYYEITALEKTSGAS
jgi:SPP1 family predicted phage head-tail adaptor